ncbi:CDP-diacylglycerol diphosphatase [Streptomyces sp. NBC_01387]|uniref:CDP-diacylglycerol diphosphatase n=1 Tax=unclassified Streptomyces TaxID=2593676 RepID=UPI002DD8AB8C|nr:MULTISPECIES: CDP-diacylglycerol diphosphatase [unclassified Streptomyces]WSC22238.1 CDP-diacylglycerol diphosphatase [Streptomyces sp. NBC_01766]WSV56085.1 CDP-diacylglycerol diphosphatase [Streptomyces sp. NBC_01014]
MNDDKTSNELPRRRFVALSGVIGAATLLTGVEATTGRTASAAAPTYADPTPDTCPTPPPGGTPTCPPAQLQPLCGKPSDNDSLWRDVEYCTHGKPLPPGQNPPACLKVTSDYVVLHGRPSSQHNFLLTPSCRITGIECPFIETSGAPNYWNDAWDNARSGGSVPVQYPNIGLGINSQSARVLNQLHIHMAGVRASTQRRLQDLEMMGRMATNPAQWDAVKYRVPVTGSDGSGDRTYRALRLPSLGMNLFAQLQQHVVKPNGLNMANQTLIVVPKMTATGFAGAFYVLNSDSSLHDGTNTCDHLLVYS